MTERRIALGLLLPVALAVSGCGGGAEAGTPYGEVNTLVANCGNHWIGVLEAPADPTPQAERARAAIPACEAAVRGLTAARVGTSGSETLRSLQQRALDDCKNASERHLAVFRTLAGGGQANFTDQRDAVEAERACSTARVAWANADYAAH